ANCAVDGVRDDLTFDRPSD
ncbi:hypothetical protein A2U01_0063977, partial [Trifolium medium]|nr:hypothetical protein [Trifolium medium]